MTNFEYFIRKEKDNKVTPSDIVVMCSLANSGVTVTDKEKELAEKIISDKKITANEMCHYYADYSLESRRKYNAKCGAVWRNLTKEQWILLRKYYSANRVGDDE